MDGTPLHYLYLTLKLNVSFTEQKWLFYYHHEPLLIHSRDDKGVGVTHEIKPPKHQPQISQKMIGQYWLDKTKPKQAFRLTRNSFKKLPQNFKKNYVTEFSPNWLTDWLTDW